MKQPAVPVLILSALIVSSLAAAAQGQETGTRYLRDAVIEKGNTTGGVVCVGCSVTVDGTSTDDVVAVGGNIVIRGVVEGDAVAAGGTIRLLEGARVAGDAVAVGGLVSKAAGAEVKGDADPFPWVSVPGQRSVQWRGVLSLWCVTLISLLLPGLLLRRRRGVNLGLTVLRHPFATGLVGIILAGLYWCLLTALDRPGRVFDLLAYSLHGFLLVVLLAGLAGVGWAAGGLLAKGRGLPVTLTLGAVLLSILMLVPVAGFFVMLAAGFLAYGAPIIGGFGADPDWILHRIPRGRSGPRPADPS